MLTLPPVPSFTRVRFALVVPAHQFRFEASGLADPVGQTVKKLQAVVLVAVMLRIPAATPDAATPPAPVTWTSICPPVPSVLPALGCPLAGRVSVIRPGTIPTCPPAVPLGAMK